MAKPRPAMLPASTRSPTLNLALDAPGAIAPAIASVQTARRFAVFFFAGAKSSPYGHTWKTRLSGWEVGRPDIVENKAPVESPVPASPVATAGSCFRFSGLACGKRFSQFVSRATYRSHQ